MGRKPSRPRAVPRRNGSARSQMVCRTAARNNRAELRSYGARLLLADGCYKHQTPTGAASQCFNVIHNKNHEANSNSGFGPVHSYSLSRGPRAAYRPCLRAGLCGSRPRSRAPLLFHVMSAPTIYRQKKRVEHKLNSQSKIQNQNPKCGLLHHGAVDVLDVSYAAEIGRAVGAGTGVGFAHV